MAYTSAQIVALACQIAKGPNYLSMAGQLFNAMLEELWETNDFAFSRKKATINTTVAQPSLGYALPTDHERTLEVFYTVNGAPSGVIQVPIEDYDGLFQGVTGFSYPEFFCVDVSQSPRTVLVYPVAPLAVSMTMRYLPQQAPIATPETSSTIPWFPGQLYLITRLASEVMKITDDTRQDKYAADAEKMLSRFLTMGEDDRGGYARQVKLDPRSFRQGSNLKPTKSMPL